MSLYDELPTLETRADGPRQKVGGTAARRAAQRASSSAFLARRLAKKLRYREHEGDPHRADALLRRFSWPEEPQP